MSFYWTHMHMGPVHSCFRYQCCCDEVTPGSCLLMPISVHLVGSIDPILVVGWCRKSVAWSGTQLKRWQPHQPEQKAGCEKSIWIFWWSTVPTNNQSNMRNKTWHYVCDRSASLFSGTRFNIYVSTCKSKHYKKLMTLGVLLFSWICI